MRISLNIILDSISHYEHELHVELPAKINFRRVLLLPKKTADIDPDCLYVCTLSDAMRIPDRNPDVCLFCIRDRIRDKSETEEKLRGMIIINENLEFEQLFSEIQDTFVKLNNWYETMQEAIISHKSMQDIITLSEPIIGNFISVSDSALSLLAYTKNIPTDDEISLFLIKNGYHSTETINKFKELGRFNIWMKSDGPIVSNEKSFSKHTIISKVFKFNDTYFTHVVMTCNHYKMTDGLLDLFGHLNTILGYYIHRNWQEEKEFNHIYNSFIVDLMVEKGLDKESVDERARMVGIKPSDEYIVMLLTGKDRCKSVFPGRIAQDISMMFPRIRTVCFNSRLILFLNHEDISFYIEQQEIEKKLNNYFRENNIFCGVSDKFNDLLELPQAYNQAEAALNESMLYCQSREAIPDESPTWSNIAFLNEHYASCLLDKSEKSRRLWKNSKYGKLLAELYNSDIEKNTNNLKMLYTYLMNERRAKETADLLHMHRNNVVYRISRIEEMLNISLEDKMTRLNLMLSFLMLRCFGMTQEKNYTHQYLPDTDP